MSDNSSTNETDQDKMNVRHLKEKFKSVCFLDRDGTINVNTGYAHRCSELELLPNAADGIRLLNENQVAVVVVTNQSGIGRGYFGYPELAAFHSCMEEELGNRGAKIDVWRFCPHHPNEKCDCRKPKTGMINDILGCNFNDVFFVGDSLSDMHCAQSAGATPIALVGTEAETFEKAVTAPDLLDAARFIINQVKINERGAK
jgi:D-glycero-D-manno-heptose 1,7-bisphosphate phosphatase